MEAIIYTSNTGSTAQYATLLGEELGIPAYSLQEAHKYISTGTEVIYMGWLMAGAVKGYKNAVKKYKVNAVCAVGMGQTGSQIREVRQKNGIPSKIPVFTLQGGFELKKLHGIYRMMMNVMVKTAGKALEKKTDRTLEEDDMLDMMQHGGNRVKVENLSAVSNWVYEKADSIV